MRHFRPLLTLFGTLLTAPAFAQTPAQAPASATPPATARITGTVLDSASRQPIAYATVVLLKADAGPADKPLTGVAADEEGRFTISKVAAGTYRVRATYVGFRPLSRTVTVADGATVSVSTFALASAAKELSEAVVTGEKPIVEVKPDRLIYNAEQDASNAGGTAADVLRKAPLLSVDGDGNPKLRGSGNFKVLVNNKPSPTLARNLAEALKGMPADQIKSIEVITTPPARYDAEGTAGIINIILKKGVDRGLNGSVGASTGNRNSSVNSSLNFKKGKVGVSTSLNTGGWYGPQQFTRDRTDYAVGDAGQRQQPTGNLHQLGEGRYGGQWYYGTLGIDYDPAEHHSFSLNGSINGGGGFGQQDIFNQYAAVANPVLQQLYTRATRELFSWTNQELTGTYTRTFATPRREWTVLAQAARNGGTYGYRLNQFNTLTAGDEANAAYRERSAGRTPGAEYTLQTDFTQPIGEKQTLDVGAKGIWRHTASVGDIDGFTPGQDADFVPLPSRRTDFTYDQQVQALYGIYGFSLGTKWNFSLGTRAERTALQADFRTTGTRFTQDYYNVLPNGSVQYKISEPSSLRLAYSKRISRPFIDYLNPYVDSSNALNISYGNPRLNPELTDSYELSYNTLIKTATISISGSVRRTGNAIESVRLPTDRPGVSANTFANVASNAFYQLNFYGSVKPLPKWELSGGPDVQYITRTSPTLGIRRRDGFTGGLNANTSYQLPKDFSLNAFVYYSLSTPNLQGRGGANLYYSIGAKKQLFKQKADLTLNIQNPFNDYWAYRNNLDTPYLTERNEYRNYQRAFRLSFTYRFGQAQQGKQRKSISNDDKKGGGGGGQKGG